MRTPAYFNLYQLAAYSSWPKAICRTENPTPAARPRPLAPRAPYGAALPRAQGVAAGAAEAAATAAATAAPATHPQTFKVRGKPLVTPKKAKQDKPPTPNHNQK